MDNAQKRHVLQWHLTHNCNLRCVHCYQQERAAHMPADMIWRVLEKYERYLRHIGLPGQINLTGGEPLLHPEFFALAERIRKNGHRLAVLTNGTLIDEATAERLACLRPLFVQVSLDGDEEAHDAIRGRGAFAAAINGIDRLKAHNVKVLVSFTAQKSNTGVFPQLAEICRAHGVDKLWWDRVVVSDPGQRRTLALDTEEFLELVKTANGLKAGGYAIDNGRALQFIGDDTCGGYRCSAGRELLIVLADGGLMPCRRLPFTVGNIDDGEIAETLKNSSVMRRLFLSRTPLFCTACPDVLRCFGGAKCVTYAMTGDWERPDVNCPRLKN